MKITMEYEITEAEFLRVQDILSKGLSIATPLLDAYVRKAVKSVENEKAGEVSEAKKAVLRSRLYGIAEKAVETAVKLAAAESASSSDDDEKDE